MPAIMVNSQPFLPITGSLDASLARLDAWLVNQAIHVPHGWTEACVAWLVEEHGGRGACRQLTEADWCQLMYEQWLHADLRELICPVLPPDDSSEATTAPRRGASDQQSLAMKLEGELCLQVVGLFNIGDSYYGQLRRHEGDLSVNLPCLENPNGDLWGGGEHDSTLMTQAHSQYLNASVSQNNSTNMSGGQRSFTLFVTDGVREIKAIEFGTSNAAAARSTGQSVLPTTELLRRLRPGCKVRLHGPLTLRNNVLLLPAGAIETLSHPQLQVLGGEVDELLDSPAGKVMHRVGTMLAEKLCTPLAVDGSLPAWFPKITMETNSANDTIDQAPVPIQSLSNGTSDIVMPPPRQGAVAPRSSRVSMIPPTSTDAPEAYVGVSASSTATVSSPPIEPWDMDDDALISAAAQNWEQENQTHQGQPPQRLEEQRREPNPLPITATPMIHSLADYQPDPTGLNFASRFNPPISHQLVPPTPPFDADETNDMDMLDEVDPDVFASSLDDLERSQLINRVQPRSAASPQTPSGQGTSFSRPTKPLASSSTNFTTPYAPRSSASSKSELRQTRLVMPVRTIPPADTVTSTSSRSTPCNTMAIPKASAQEQTDDLLPPMPKRKPWERNNLPKYKLSSSLLNETNIVAPKPETDFKFHPFCYIEDMYHELLQADSTVTSVGSRRRVYTIRGLLISLLSTLEHHQGSRWSLSARLADGSATVDVDFSSELLMSWIGLSAAESESLRQLSRCDANSSSVALQESQKHRHRLRTALKNFQSRIDNLSGLFELTAPPATATSVAADRSTAPPRLDNQGDSLHDSKPLRPILINYRPLDDGEWLKQLNERVRTRWGSQTLD